MGRFSDYTVARARQPGSRGLDMFRDYGLSQDELSRSLMQPLQSIASMQYVAPTLRDELQAEVDAWLKDVL